MYAAMNCVASAPRDNNALAVEYTIHFSNAACEFLIAWKLVLSRKSTIRLRAVGVPRIIEYREC